MAIFPSIYILSAAAVIVALAGFILVRKISKPIDLDEHQGFLDAMLNIVGTLVSILLGLLVAAALDHYQNLEESIDNEAANAAQLFRLSSGLPEETSNKIRKLCAAYCTEVVDDEWPAMAQGKASEKVMVTYMEIVSTIVKFKPGTEGENNIHNAMLSAMQVIGDCRRQRLLVLNSAWTSHLMPVLLMCSGIVLAFAYLYVRRGAVLHGVLICFVALALGGNIGLVYLLSNPFSGDWKIAPRGFALNRELLEQVKSSPQLEKLLGVEKNLK